MKNVYIKLDCGCILSFEGVWIVDDWCDKHEKESDDKEKIWLES